MIITFTLVSFLTLGLIAKAILSTKERRMVLSDIYHWIQVNYAYFRTRGPGWRNSIRHNLSLNDCFIKVGECHSEYISMAFEIIYN
ncbi:unnamed protein product [Protopolystoma xenopodis]|uniref:Fork-head domain-containing protein n=1 Tax=Protopolystoma xenopodis TaxID=117903 RepID=A0A448X3Z6_9PLAT|nr:unnamed protein product [Protopolystoma xenopodis]